MPAGIQAFNNNGELTFSSEGITYVYLGQATHSSTVQPTADEAGYSFYTFNYSGNSIACGQILGTSTNTAFRIVSMSKSGSTWTIKVQRGDGTTNAQGFVNETAPSMWVWGQVLSGQNYGMAVYNSSGVLTADLSRQPMTLAARADFGANVGSASWATLSGFGVVGIDSIYPICITAPNGYEQYNTGNGGYGAYSDILRLPRFWRSGSTIYRSFVQESKLDGWEPDPVSVYSDSYMPPQSVFLLDGFRFVAS